MKKYIYITIVSIIIIIVSSISIIALADEEDEHSEHTYSGWKYNSNYHWKACTICGVNKDNGSHNLSWGRDSQQHWKVCSVCGYKGEYGYHTWYVSGGHYYCTTCGYYAY